MTDSKACFSSKSLLMMLVATALVLATCQLIIRWLAPGLLGVPTDLQLVQTAREVPPFYVGVFRDEDEKAGADLLLKDPYTVTRPRPWLGDYVMYGAHDLLGFRNESIPRRAGIVVIGDSQTYGNNAPLANNWPSVAQRVITRPGFNIYSMAAGGWGAPQYLEMMIHAMRFDPRIVVVAFYTGNDALDSIRVASGNPKFDFLRPAHYQAGQSIPGPVTPSVERPGTIWKVELRPGEVQYFTPSYRLASNELNDPHVDAGYEVMVVAAKTMATIARRRGIRLVFTIVPTREFVYGAEVEKMGIPAPDAYRRLVDSETLRIASFSRQLAALGSYCDLVPALRSAAAHGLPIYGDDKDGHPVAAGYQVIGTVIARYLKRLIAAFPGPRAGLYRATDAFGGAYVLIKGYDAWLLDSKLAMLNGWTDLQNVPPIEFLGLEHLNKPGLVTVDPARFGPKAVASILGKDAAPLAQGE